MKKLILFSAFVMAGSFAHADIGSDMKQIGALFGQIGRNINDASQNQASAAAAGQMVTLFQDCANQVPDSISQMAPADQPAALADYQNMINQEIQDSAALQNAFLSNDNATAASLLQKMNAEKQDGHGKYK